MRKSIKRLTFEHNPHTQTHRHQNAYADRARRVFALVFMLSCVFVCLSDKLGGFLCELCEGLLEFPSLLLLVMMMMVLVVVLRIYAS